jgi:hypothetical protein
MLRHSFVTTMLDAGVDLRDMQIAARHADPRTAMRYARARNNVDGLSGRGQFAGTISCTARSWGAVAGMSSTHQPRPPMPGA